MHVTNTILIPGVSSIGYQGHIYLSILFKLLLFCCLMYGLQSDQ